MKAIILAAGQGTRLRPLTDDRPKCLVEFRGKPILEWILNTMRKCGITDIGLVTGYRDDCLEKYELPMFHNESFETTNMVHSLFCARDFFSDAKSDLIISYSDIIYKESVLNSLLEAADDISTTIDLEWRKLWETRMSNPLGDAETLKMDKNDYILELGKKSKTFEEIQGQYMGLIKIKSSAINEMTNYYDSLNKAKLYDGKPFEQMYMTTFLQSIINNLQPVKAVKVNGGWVEIDSIEDLNNLEKNNSIFRIV